MDAAAGTPKLILTVSYDVRPDGDHFAAETREFGMTLFSAKAEDIEARVEQAVKFYIDGFDGDANRISQYLKSHGISHAWSFDADQEVVEGGPQVVKVEVAG